MLTSGSKALFHLLAGSDLLKRAAGRYGMRSPTSFARRFIAGETVEEAIAAVRQIERQGLLHTLDYLGEGATTLDEAAAATREYLQVISAIQASDVERNLSLKLTQLGLDADRATAVDNLRRILDHAEGFFVRIDMEGSAYTEVTLNVFETLWEQGYRQFGVVLQAELHRTEQDVRRIMALGARIRLVKGAYVEPARIAYARKADVDAAYVRLVETLLQDAHYPAIATHDPGIIRHTKSFADAHAIGKDRFEFQMLYGIRRDLQASLVREGYRVRVYVPFGRQWFPYFMRRLGERPANVKFVLQSLLREGSA